MLQTSLELLEFMGQLAELLPLQPGPDGKPVLLCSSLKTVIFQVISSVSQNWRIRSSLNNQVFKK